MSTIDPALTQNDQDNQGNQDNQFHNNEIENDNEELPKFFKTSLSNETVNDNDNGNNNISDGEPAEKSQPKKRRHKRVIEREESPNFIDDGAVPGNDDDEYSLDPDQQRKVNLQNRLDFIAKGSKNSMRKRKRNDEDLDAAADEELGQLRELMFQAAEEDEESKRIDKPALNKLKLLPKVVETMQKTHLETSILENNFLDGVRRWLEPFTDKSLPPLNIQTQFFQILSNMYIDTQSLKSSKLGAVVLFYSRHPRVNASIKRAADGLVTRWMRPLLRRSANPRSHQFVESSELVRGRNVQMAPANDETVSRVRMPQVERKKYKIAATRGLDGIKSSNVKVNSQESDRQRHLSRKFLTIGKK